MVNHKKIIRSVFLVLQIQFVITIFSGCLEWLTSICNTSEKPEGASKEYYSTQCACNGISLLEMYEDSNKYKFLFDDSYVQEKGKLRIGFKKTKGETLDGVFLTWGNQREPSREINSGELLTSIKKTIFTCKNKGVYSMCLKRNNDYDNDINEVIVTIYIEDESDSKASFIIDDNGVNVYIDKSSQDLSNLAESKHTGESVSLHSPILQKSEKNVDIKGDNTQINEERGESDSRINNTKKESNSKIKNCEQTQENQNKELEVEHSFQFSDDDKRIESIMADERILKIFENDESIETRNHGEGCEGRQKHLEFTNETKEKKNKESNKENENIEKKNNKDRPLDEFKDKITYSDKKVSVSEDIDQTSLSRLRSIVGSLQVYFETEDGEVIEESIFKSRNGNILSGDFISDIKKTFLRDKRNYSFSMYPVNKRGARKCRIKIVHEGTGDFFYLTNADNKEQHDIFFY